MPGAPRPDIADVYNRLLSAYGPQAWWPADSPFEVIVGAILTQQTQWSSVEKALANLRAAHALSHHAMARLSEAEIAELVRPSGFFQSKARKLRAFLDMLGEHFDGHLHCLLRLDTDELRGALLATHGIGPETADSIVLYSARRPSFVIDAYTRRVFERLALRPDHDTYEAWRSLFMAALPADATIFNEYHALIVRHAKDVCRQEPLCDQCVLLVVCPTGRTRTASES